MKRTPALLVAACLLAGCGRAGEASPAPSGSGTGGPVSVTELKLRVLDALPGPFDYCDPDVYPVGHGTPLSNAKAAYPDMRRHEDVYKAIADHLGISSEGRPSDEDLVRIYQPYKQTFAVELHPDETNGYTFALPVVNNSSGYDDQIQGTVSADGVVEITKRVPGNGGDHYFDPNCPICLARGVRIGTPSGPVAVDRVRVGMRVWSVNARGRRIVATVLRTRRRPATGILLRVGLANGRSVLVSPRHPAADGLPVGELAVGDRLDGVRITTISFTAYRGYTDDLLPSGPTGDYFANGILLGSTLSR